MKKILFLVLCLILVSIPAKAGYIKYMGGVPVSNTTFGTARNYTPIGATNYAYQSRFNVPTRTVIPARPALPALPSRPYGYYGYYRPYYYNGYGYNTPTVVNIGTTTQTETATTTTPSRLNSSTGATVPTKTYTINGVTYYN